MDVIVEQGRQAGHVLISNLESLFSPLLERRHRVLKLAAKGATRAILATKLGIGGATVYRIFALLGWAQKLTCRVS